MQTCPNVTVSKLFVSGPTVALFMLLSHYDGKTGTEFSKKLSINLKWGIWAQIWAHLCGF